MKNSIIIKFIAVALCALSILGIIASGCGILFMEEYNLYNEPLEARKQAELESLAFEAAWYHAEWHAADSLSNCPQEVLNEIISNYHYLTWQLGGNYAVEIYEGEELVRSINSPDMVDVPYFQTFTVTPNYPIITYQYAVDEDGRMQQALGETTPSMETEGLPAATADPAGMPTEPAQVTEVPSEDSTQVTTPAGSATEAPGLAVPDGDIAAWNSARDAALAKVEGQEVVFSTEHSEVAWGEDGTRYQIISTLDYYEGPTYEVKVYLDENVALGTEYALMSVMYPYRDSLIPLLLVSLVFFAVTLVYLLASAGRSTTGELRPSALNRLPLDLYVLGVVGGVSIIVVLLAELLNNYSGGYYGIWDNIPLCMLILGLGGFAIALLVVGFLCAFAAQVKSRDGFWWRHSVCGWCLRQLFRFLKWVGRGLGYLRRGIRGVFNLLPVIWQWLVTAVLMVLCPAVFLFFTAVAWRDFWTFLWGLLFVGCLVADAALVCYGAWCFGTLLKGARNMAQGNLDHKINTKYLYGCFRDFSIQLNNLAEGAKIAAERQMKSERMKTELITNVSHDIKTPLTSIINYVDLMKKPHSESEDAQYLDVLDRQSQRLKKLIDDLMEMSKASSGNVAVELSQVDAVEAVNQALGEFADKLASVNLTPVFRHPDFPVTMVADGRLVWRVLSNLLSNAVKYALPDTRLYVDLMMLQGNAVIAIKNISREQLNVNADELMERFVRGDSSRNTEGSGLGLNIAKSLVELQHGQMHLMVDGDLFKVTLIFPCA